MTIEFKPYKKSDIPNLLNDTGLWNDRFLVSSKHRMLSHFNNPNADFEDYVLLLAFLEGRLVGYLGIYMDYVYFSDSKEKIGWLSTWWLHPESAGKGVGKQMLSQMYELQNGKIGISQFTPSAKRVYDKSGYFYSLNELNGCKIDVRFNLSYLLPLVNTKFRRIKGLLIVIDSFLNSIISFWHKVLKVRFNSDLSSIKIDYLSYIDNDTEVYILRQQENNIIKRDGKFFQFLKNYQWLQESPVMELVEEKDKYFFSDYCKRFNIYNIKVSDEAGTIIGFLSILCRNRELKVLYSYYEIGHVNTIAKLLVWHAINLNVSTIITYDRELSTIYKMKRGLRLRYKDKKRMSIISKIYGIQDFSKFKFHYGDGDCSFA